MASTACALSESPLPALHCTWAWAARWGWASRLPMPRFVTCHHHALLLVLLQVCAAAAGPRSCRLGVRAVPGSQLWQVGSPTRHSRSCHDLALCAGMLWCASIHLLSGMFSQQACRISACCTDSSCHNVAALAPQARRVLPVPAGAHARRPASAEPRR